MFINANMNDSLIGHWPLQIRMSATVIYNGAPVLISYTKVFRITIYATRAVSSPLQAPLFGSGSTTTTVTSDPILFNSSSDPYVSGISSDGILEFGLTSPTLTSRRLLAEEETEAPVVPPPIEIQLMSIEDEEADSI